MTYRTVYDAAIPPASPPETDGAMVYVGGDTQFTWNDADIAMQGSRGLIPVWVYGLGRSGAADGAQFASWLQARNVPRLSTVVLDWETHVDLPYADGFFQAMTRWHVVGYGSLSTLFANDTMDGWWPADWTGHPHLYPHVDVLGTQYAAAQLRQTAGQYDLSLIAPEIEMWKRGEENPLIEWKADGTMSLAQLALLHNTAASTILRLTLAQQSDGKFPGPLAAYINGHNLDRAIPKGIALYYREGTS